jgi:putative methyltransferase
MLRIYLADLVYDTVKTNHVVPLNVAYLAANLHKQFGSEVETTIFKYPTELETALKTNQPDILGLSHYSWNKRLNELFLRLAKRLNPRVITVMGGPNIRTDPTDVSLFLTRHPELDYCVLYEGEEPFATLVGALLKGDRRPSNVRGCATLLEGSLVWEPMDFQQKPKEIDLPSPYITGFLDRFLGNPNMIPLIETNRGCPFGCVYCVWGIAAQSRVRLRPLDLVFKEIDYIAEKSAGQPEWIFCDANFGLLPRDVEIARKVSQIRDKKGYPIIVTVYHSKNTSDRNNEIATILGSNLGYIAIQSADPVVLHKSGRGNIRVNEIEKQIKHYKTRGLQVVTDILVGLPGETANSHLNTLKAAFNMGFDRIDCINIRLLPGSTYETDEYRRRYRVRTRFRPIFGAYGIYDGQSVFEIEESVRGTCDMTEEELNSFKVLHWLIYFGWNAGFFKPLLRLGQQYNVSPVTILDQLARTERHGLKSLFESMKAEAVNEWFESEEEMIRFYEQEENFNWLVKSFMKLIFLYTALVYQHSETIRTLQDETIRILKNELSAEESCDPVLIRDVADLQDHLMCRDLLQAEMHEQCSYSGPVVAIVMNEPTLMARESVDVEIYRPHDDVALCRFHLKPNGRRNLSLPNLARFLEEGGMGLLRYRARVLPRNHDQLHQTAEGRHS